MVLDDLVGADGVCRVIDAFVDGLAMAELGFERAEAADTGRPGYDPRDLLKLYLCGYLHQPRSSRRLEAECRRNVDLMWLLGRLYPDQHSQRRGTTPVLQADEARALLDAIDTTFLRGLRDRALVGLMVYTFARVGAAVSMKVEDFFVQGRRGWVRLHEKGGKEHEMPTHHNLERYLEEYISAAGIGQERKERLFRTTRGRSGELTGNSLLQSDVWSMIRRRALAAGIKTEIGCHTFRATGITAYLKNGGKLEIAQQMAAHESARTTGLYNRRSDELTR